MVRYFTYGLGGGGLHGYTVEIISKRLPNIKQQYQEGKSNPMRPSVQHKNKTASAIDISLIQIFVSV